MIRYNLPCLYPCGGIGGDSMIRYNLPCLYPRGGIGGDSMRNTSIAQRGTSVYLRGCAYARTYYVGSDVECCGPRTYCGRPYILLLCFDASCLKFMSYRYWYVMLLIHVCRVDILTQVWR